MSHNGDNEVLREAQRMMEEGIIPDEVTQRLLWAGLIARSRSEEKLKRALDRIDGRLKVDERIAVLAFGGLTGVGGYLAKLLIDHIESMAR